MPSSDSLLDSAAVAALRAQEDMSQIHLRRADEAAKCEPEHRPYADVMLIEIADNGACVRLVEPKMASVRQTASYILRTADQLFVVHGATSSHLQIAKVRNRICECNTRSRRSPTPTT